MQGVASRNEGVHRLCTASIATAIVSVLPAVKDEGNLARLNRCSEGFLTTGAETNMGCGADGPANSFAALNSPLPRVTGKLATDGEQRCSGVMPTQQGSAAQRPLRLRPASKGLLAARSFFWREEESDVTPRRSASWSDSTRGILAGSPSEQSLP